MTMTRRLLAWLRPADIPHDALLAFVPFGLLLLSLLSVAFYQTAHPDALRSLAKALFAFWTVVIVLVSLPAIIRYATASKPPKT